MSSTRFCHLTPLPASRLTMFICKAQRTGSKRIMVARPISKQRTLRLIRMSWRPDQGQTRFHLTSALYFTLAPPATLGALHCLFRGACSSRFLPFCPTNTSADWSLDDTALGQCAAEVGTNNGYKLLMAPVRSFFFSLVNTSLMHLS